MIPGAYRSDFETLRWRRVVAGPAWFKLCLTV